MSHKIIYTDGACLGNPGPGGWGWYEPKTGESASGGDPKTTNNRMELAAVIEALKTFIPPKAGTLAAAPPLELVIYSDSKYIVDCFQKKWYEGWIKRGWKTTAKKAVKNQDLWRELLELALNLPEGQSVDFQWVEGHSGDPGNEMADSLAYEAAQKAAQK